LTIYRTNFGLDVHARSVVAYGIDNETGEVFRRRLGGGSAEVVSFLVNLPGPMQATYEAGPTGFGLYRALDAAGIDCLVAAPSKLQRPVGEKVKTDMNDAEHLCRLLRLGQVVAVTVPTPDREGYRDLVRAHEDTRQQLMAARHRVSKLLLRQGLIYDDGQTWTAKHYRWLLSHRFTQPGLRIAYENDCEVVAQATARRERLEKEIIATAAISEFTPIVDRLGVLRGMAPLTAFSLAVEIGDWHRFSGKTIGSFIGLTPSEASSGSTRSLGSITKVGNAHARRLLVEAAWQHKRDLRTPGPVLARRRENTTGPVRLRGDLGNQRLHNQWVKYTAHHKKTVVANIAVARELAGWCWSLATMDN